VKQTFAAAAHPERDPSLPPGLPVPAPPAGLRLLTRGAERPDEAELDANSRSAPARLRAAERAADALPDPVLRELERLYPDDPLLVSTARTPADPDLLPPPEVTP
jgi:hypothetical protein